VLKIIWQISKAQAKKDMYVETIMGRRLYLNEINAANGLRRQAAERAAINAPSSRISSRYN